MDEMETGKPRLNVELDKMWITVEQSLLENKFWASVKEMKFVETIFMDISVVKTLVRPSHKINTGRENT